MHNPQHQLIRKSAALITFSIFRLAGVVGYTPGHFVAYCRRITGRWLLCNNLKTAIESCNDKTVIIPHGIIYIVQ